MLIVAGAQASARQTVEQAEQRARDALIEAKVSAPETTIPLFESPAPDAAVVALIEPGVVAELYECDGIWCAAKTGEIKGWLEQSRLWGVYPDEEIED